MTDDAIEGALAEQRRRSAAMVAGLASAANLGSVRTLGDVGDATSTEWWTTADVCRYLRLNERTVYKLVDEGEIPAFRFGRVIRYRRADLDAFVESCRVQPGTVGRGSL